jgi:hypothetical protein
MGAGIISWRCSVIAASACSLIGCAGFQRERSSQGMWERFEGTLAGLAGSGAVDCGHSVEATENVVVRACVTKHLAGQDSFRASSVVQGIDSQLVFGIARNDRGEAFAVETVSGTLPMSSWN